MDQSTLNKILENHKKWLNNEAGGVKAVLRGTDLRGLGLQGIDLRYADLRYTNLQGAILRYAKAQHADLLDTNFQYADLCNTNLRYADLEKANLRNTYLCWFNWDEVAGVSVYVAGLKSSRKNAQLTYIPSIDIVTTGCFQGSWQALKEKVTTVYKTDNPTIYHKYQLAIAYIEAQIKADNDSK